MTDIVNVKQYIESRVKPRLELWAKVICSGAGGSGLSSIFASYSEPGGDHVFTSIEYSAKQVEQAMQTAEDINQLPAEHVQVIHQEYLRGGTIIGKAQACECSVQTYYQRLNMAHESLYFKWFDEVCP